MGACAIVALVSTVFAKSPTSAARNAIPANNQAGAAIPPAPDDGTKQTADGKDDDAPKPPSDGRKYDLRYKLNTGEVLRYTVTHHAAIRSTIDESTQAAETTTESVKVWKVTDVLPNHQIEFMDVIERVHMFNQLPDRASTEYDSAKDKTPPPGYEDTAKAIGVPLSVVRMTPRGEVVSHKIKYQQAPAEPDAQVVVRLPDAPVEIGATWDEPYEIKVQLQSGGEKPIQTRRHYKLVEVKNGIASIDVSYQVLSPMDSEVESKLVGRLSKGTVKFDIARGRVVSQDLEVDKRVLGFAGATSSMHYLMEMEEELADAPPKPLANIGKQPAKQSQRSASKPNAAGTFTR
jgi:hypothetical protein